MQQERVQDPYPWTWEVPAGVVAAVGLAVVLGWQAARSIANWVVGAGWVWPDADRLFGSVPGLLSGDAAAGVRLGAHAASSTLLWIAMALATVLVIAGGGIAALWGWRRWGSGRVRGMASISEARQALGADRLYRARRIVRPDLYPTHARRLR